MKDIIKQKNIIALICCVVCAIALMIWGQISNDKVKVISQMEDALNENDKYTFVDCFLPEEQEDAEIAFGLMNLDEIYEEFSDEEIEYTFKFLQSERVEVNTYESKVEVVVAIYDGSECVGIEKMTLTIIKEDGREYIKGWVV